MRQYQVKFNNKESFTEKLLAIRDACGNAPYGGITFYISWTEGSREDIETLTGLIDELFPNALYYGNEASGSIADGEFAFGINVCCCVFERNDSRAELVWVEKGSALSSLEDLWKYCNTREGLRAVEMIPSMAYVETLAIDGNVPDISADVLLFGGASVNYDNATYDADIVAKGHPRTKDGMAVVLYFGSDMNFFSSNILGWKGLGRLMEVTDSTGKCIREIDGKPAYSIYEKYLNLSLDDRDTLVFPLIVEEDENQYIRTPQTVMADKSMQMFANIPNGTKVRISYGDKNTILSEINAKAKEIAEFNPEAIRAYSCAARRLFWGDDEVGKETLPLQEIAGVCGFYTGGEILRFGSRLRVLNQTLAIVGFREGDGKEKVKREAIKQSEDISLISRLTYFAEKIVEEEKEQRLLAEGFESAFTAQYQVMYYINLAEGKATFLHGDDAAKTFLPIFNTRSAESLLANFHKMYVDTVVAEEDRERVKSVMNPENVFRVLRDNPSISVNYRVRRNLVDYVYTEMRLIKVAADDNGEVNAVILAFKLSDEELRTALEVQQKLREDARVIGALSESFACVYYVDINSDKADDTAVEVRTSELQRRLVPELNAENNFSKKLDVLRDNLVYGPDREQFTGNTRREVIMESLAYSDIHIVNTRFSIEGEVKYYQLQFSAVRDEGSISEMVVGIRSVDEQMRKELETQKQLEAALENAKVANESKSTFLFNMSHDIRTPMNAIKGFTAMAKKYVDDRERVTDYLDKIDISGQQLLTLINQVLEMSRIESGVIELEEKPVNIRESFNSMITVIEAQARVKGLTFKFSFEDLVHYYVLADDSRMGQITLNVVGNAIKYTPEGGIIDFRLRELPCSREGYAAYKFTVADTGIGMSREFIDKLYEPFSRENTSTVSHIQGTGLGMSIVKNLVDLLGGTIEVESEIGKGTRFDIFVELPIAENPEVVDTPEEIHRPVSFEGCRVLLVEDNEMNREIAKDILEEYGFIVEEAEDGDIAVAMCRDAANRGEYGYYDVILMDIQMPRMDGYAATREIRAIPSPENTHVPIIAMTANAFDEDRQNALAAGMDEHLAKPIEIQRLLETLGKFL